ncbi:hypothetical protein K503DRAFT_110329 [Rhizopogon vinicolor AM-OR11-026]|uniref:Uncharacterized protein n=1 Tax=Rhizopogon vinicolor AM-OR11-026 TaxID=1314800 RepID=A0A1B7MF35_9AGAM|nr:hypothetical protein K503DRAFT_110329 [Rhizopogon vinicolor AM-OR11-026]
MIIVHIARPLCCEIIFSHKLTAGTCPNIDRSNKFCSIASATAHHSGVGLAKFTTIAVRGW